MKPLTPTTPHVIIMVGIPGSGKTHFAEHFAKTFSAPYVNQAALKQISDTTDTHAAELSNYVLEELLKTHRTIIYEGPTHLRSVRQALIRKITNAGYEPFLVWVQTESSEAMHRTLKANRSLDAQAYEALLKSFQRPAPSENAVVISGKHTYSSQVKMVLKRLSGNTRPEPEAPTKRPPAAGRHIAVR